MKVIASLTTTPYRIDKIKNTLDSILSQTIPVESIEINVPYIFKRTGEEYIVPDWLSNLADKEDSKIKIFRTEDYGAMTKVAPTLIRYKGCKDTLIWSLDDDFKYPVNMLAVIFREYIPGRNYVLSHSKGSWKYEVGYCVGYESTRREGSGCFAEGWNSILYPAHLVEDDFENYIIKTSTELDNRNSDDIILSNYFVLKKHVIYNVAYPYSLERNLMSGAKQEYGEAPDALHHQGGGNTERYIRVFNWLTENNINAWLGASMRDFKVDS